MAYQESQDQFDEENESLQDEEFDNEEATEDFAFKDKAPKKGRHGLEIRRAIENHLENTKLRKELDYFFDDDFSNDNESESK